MNPPSVTSGFVDLSPLDLAIALNLLVYAVVLGATLGVRLGREIALGAVRAFVQLSLMGYALRYLFAADSQVLVVVTAAIMVLFATHEARRRAKKHLPGFLGIMAAAIGAGLVLGGGTTILAVIRPTPWLAPQTAIPVLGLVTGASLTGATIAQDRLVAELSLRRHEVEAALALGATPWQASREAVRQAFHAAMIPPLNSLMVVGVVHIPGTMTGLILAGKDPAQGAYYQLVISFAVVGCVAITSAVASVLGSRRLFTDRAQLRTDLLTAS
jgi:putative ABC transport system permease protein